MFSFGVTVPQGGSYGIKIANRPDGWGGKQIFWGMHTSTFPQKLADFLNIQAGNYRVDRNGDHMIKADECNRYMEEIYASGCQGFGGWVNTDFGTVRSLDFV